MHAAHGSDSLQQIGREGEGDEDGCGQDDNNGDGDDNSGNGMLNNSRDTDDE